MQKLIRILAVVAVASFCLRTFSDNKADVDLWGNVGFVKALPWQSGFHYTNDFSYTEPGHPWTNHEWLAQYIFHVVHASTGNTGLLVLKMILGFAVMLLMTVSVRRAVQTGPVTFFYFLLVVCTMGYGFGTRPHHFTYLLYSSMLFCLKNHPRNRALMLGLFPALAVLWVNLHGAFFIGLLLLSVFTVLSGFERSDRPPLRLAAASTVLFLAMATINPCGLRLWEFIFQSMAKFRPYLSEWAPFNPALHWIDHMDFIVLTALSIAAIAFSRRPRSPAWLGVLALSFAAALMMRRNIPLFAITAGFVVTEHAEDAARKPLDRLVSVIPRPALAVILCCFIAVSAWFAATFDKESPLEIEVSRDSFAVDAVDFIKQNGIEGNALVFFDWAEYCIWHIPQCPVFLDGRFRSAYSVRAIDNYFQFLYAGNDWQRALDEYPTDIVLIHKDNPAFAAMVSRKDWLLAYKGRTARLFLRIARYEQLIQAIAEGRISLPEYREKVFFP